MRFLKNFLINLLIVAVAGFALYLYNPTIMGQVFKAYGALFGPIGIIAIIVFALPRRRSRD